MKPLIRFYIYNLGYWLVLSFVARLVFVLFYLDAYPRDDWANLFSSFIYGLRLDISMSSYIVALTFLLWYIYYNFKIGTFFLLYKGLGIVALCLILLITLADVGVYHHWAMKINITALQFAYHPREVMASIGSEDHLPLLILIYLILLVGFLWWWFKLVAGLKYTLIPNLKNRILSLISFILISGISILGIRGGIQLEPINQSAVYFSDQAIYNHTAINATWNLMNKWINNRDGKNPYQYGTPSEIDQSIGRFYTSRNRNESLVNPSGKPNIVFILLEGFTADVINAFGGEAGLTPTIDSLIRHGLIFTRFYANGDRTYKGLPAILNGYPTQPSSSITQNADKTGKMASMAKTLSKAQYTSSFYYGGESEFANIKSYLLNTGFNKIVDIRDFPYSYRGLKWGVSDHYVFERLSKELNSTAQPFFSCILTLSSHEPYDIPMDPLIKSKALPMKIKMNTRISPDNLSQVLTGFRWYQYPECIGQ